MPDVLIRNLPPVLHARLKAAAAAHKRSVAQETIAAIEAGLSAAARPALPEPLKPSRPITMKETLLFIDEGSR